VANRIPRPGGELPTYMVGKPKRGSTVTKQSFQRTLDTMTQTGYGSKNYVNTPSTKNYAQRSYTLGGTTVKDGEVLTRRTAKKITSKRPVGPTR